MADLKTLIFIPDITGFSDFVNTTEIKHSQHIITELLEIIIDSDKLNMKVSEIEGDAVLFFKNEVPSAIKLIEQCQQTFTNFHNHLRRYDTERICRCGACESASKLSLKFIIHSGDVENIKIKDHFKLHGSSLILAHRLLKNSIEEKEYILLSDTIPIDQKSIVSGRIDNIDLNQGSDTYDNQPEVFYNYMPLGNVLAQLPEDYEITFPGLSHQKIIIENSIHAPIDLIYENFTNFEKRLQWNEEIKDIILKGKSLNKRGSLHACLVGNYTLDIESLGRLEDDDKILYGERLNKFRGLRDIISIYTFQKHGNITKIKVEVDFRIKSFVGRLIKPVVRRMLQKQAAKGLIKLKEVCEEQTGKQNHEKATNETL
jgi:uncharacterized protein DUF2652